MKKEVKRSKTLRKFWQEKLEEWETSGLSGSAWCRKNQLSYYQFNYWRNIFISKPLPSKSISVSQEDFIEIKEDTQSEEGSSGIELRWNQLNISLGKQFHESTLKKLLRVMNEVESCF